MTTPPPRPALSITLPPSFEFHYQDGQLPKTPEHHGEEKTILEPPPPPRQTFKLRRKRAALPFQGPDIVQDSVIPTIEMSEAASESSSPLLQPNASDYNLLAPLPAVQRVVTPPKTPISRLAPSFDSPSRSPANEWSMINTSSCSKSHLERAGSVCSSFSDSSVSSGGSSAFSAPTGAASPESQATDPFVDDYIPHGSTHWKLAAEHVQGTDTPAVKRVKTGRHVKWTQAMDDHLWMVYMQYLSDPRVTPFKMLPGTAPPLGVCSRVASKAKRTWSQHRISTPAPLDVMMASDFSREDSPDTIRPDAKEVKQPRWPRSEGTTRRRLRDLCKRMPTLAAHYQRLLVTRSPSPFQSSSTASRSSEPPVPSFSGRDMKVSLAAATAPSMQPEGPLAQLAQDESRPQPLRADRPADWFARIGRSQAHQKSLSLQSGLSLSGTQPPSTLASPFNAMSDRDHLLQSMAATRSLGRTENGKAPKLDSPVELHGPSTLPRSLKRRFKSDEEKPKRPALQDVFATASEDNIISRNRGFSMGAVRASDNLAQLFMPLPAIPSGDDHIMSGSSFETPSTPTMPGIPDLSAGCHSAPRRLAEPVPRLGSPFIEVAASNRQHNTFPRSFTSTDSSAMPFKQRLRQLQNAQFDFE
nr:hypothetical protein CFP56_70515 [Quercus suber]